MPNESGTKNALFQIRTNSIFPVSPKGVYPFPITMATLQIPIDESTRLNEPVQDVFEQLLLSADLLWLARIEGMVIKVVQVKFPR